VTNNPATARAAPKRTLRLRRCSCIVPGIPLYVVWRQLLSGAGAEGLAHPHEGVVHSRPAGRNNCAMYPTRRNQPRLARI
jgi:hypothetical protein